MAAAEFCRKGIVAKSCPDAVNFIGRNADADAGAANEDASVKGTVGNSFGNFFGNVGIVAAIAAQGAVVGKFNAFFFQIFFDVFLQFKSAVIGAKY